MTTKRTTEEHEHERTRRAGSGAERPQSVDAALALAARHGRNALAEALLAGHALLDAASLALTGRPATQASDLAGGNEAVRALARLVGGLDDLAEKLRADDADGTRRLVDALLDALDSEIGRWETQARSDPDARAVLRAFLGLRELLWELGLRPEAAAEPASTAPPTPRPKRRRKDPARAAKKEAPPRTAASAAAGPRRRRRVQRVDVES